MITLENENCRVIANANVTRVNVDGKTMWLVGKHESLEVFPPLSEKKKRNIMKVLMDV